ncbi:MAG TPA: aromatic ring-hydroxylating dioxygenase subunit alpha [Candidatus Acidoferrales bacterium]|nr:aromatic ring-hydroxylating dioxygenase subunit alpha [Candidatus Acidoferrales bacterium]
MPDYDALIDTERGMVSRDVFVDADVYRDELERVFARAWLFVGHESQIPNTGDFFVSRMGEESVILCRDREKKVHVFLNTCRHRGMKVCRYDQGNTPLFTCPYHAWSYATDGTLAGVPMYAALYEGVLDRAQWSLIEVAHMALYKGTVWATWDPHAPPFPDYLGDAKVHLDSVLDCRDGREGGSEVLGGITKWIVPSSWKFGAENFLGDGYHVVSHRSVELVGIGPSARAGAGGRRDGEATGFRRIWVSFPQGHGVHSILRPPGDPYAPTFAGDPEVEAYFKACHEARKARLGEKSRLVGFNGTIFPNTSFHATQPRSIFVWHPHSATSMEVWRFYLVDADAPDAVKDALRRYYMRYSGPSGMTEQDDMENWNYATAASSGTIARRHPYNYQQSLRAPKASEPLAPGVASFQYTEEMARRFYRRWRDYMKNEGWDVLCPSPSTASNGVRTYRTG